MTPRVMPPGKDRFSVKKRKGYSRHPEPGTRPVQELVPHDR